MQVGLRSCWCNAGGLILYFSALGALRSSPCCAFPRLELADSPSLPCASLFAVPFTPSQGVCAASPHVMKNKNMFSPFANTFRSGIDTAVSAENPSAPRSMPVKTIVIRTQPEPVWINQSFLRLFPLSQAVEPSSSSVPTTACGR